MKWATTDIRSMLLQFTKRNTRLIILTAEKPPQFLSFIILLMSPRGVITGSRSIIWYSIKWKDRTVLYASKRRGWKLLRVKRDPPFNIVGNDRSSNPQSYGRANSSLQRLPWNSASKYIPDWCFLCNTFFCFSICSVLSSTNNVFREFCSKNSNAWKLRCGKGTRSDE
jgi:hypothetical protein